MSKDIVLTNDTDSQYLVHCIKCRTTDKLQMIPHRYKGAMVGWVFVCKEHEQAVYDAYLSPTDEIKEAQDQLKIAQADNKRLKEALKEAVSIIPDYVSVGPSERVSLKEQRARLKKVLQEGGGHDK